MRSWVRCGREVCPPRPGDDDLDLVRGRGDGADAQTHLPRVEGRVAVQREDAVDAREPALGDDVLGSPGHQLLGRLEDEAHAGAVGTQPVLDRAQREGRSEQGRRVDVVAAGVADPLGPRRERQAGLLADRQGVEVGPQRDPAGGLRGADVGDETGAAQPAHGDAGPLEPRGDDARRAHLAAPQLGVLVQVPPDRDELVRAA